MRYHLSLLISLFLVSTPVLGNENDPHKVLNEFLGRVENLKLGQSISIFDLEKTEKEVISKLKKIAKTNPKALLRRDSNGKTIAMRAAHAGLINTLSEVIKIRVINRSLRNTRDNRGFSTADQVVTAPLRTREVCENKGKTDDLSGALWASYASGLKSYEKILDAFVNKVPTNPRTVANTWLKECPNAATDVRKKMATLSKENSSRKIQTFLLNESRKFADELWRRKEQVAIAKSKPKLDSTTAKALKTADIRKIGPIELAENPKGDGVLIAKIDGDRSKLKADTNGKLDVYASVGHRVTHIEYIQLSSFDDVDKAIAEFREKDFKNLNLTLYIGERYGQKVIDITVPFN